MNLVMVSKWLLKKTDYSAIFCRKNQESAIIGGQVTVQGTKTGR